MWFVRFAMDRQCRTLACGTRSGHVFVWDPADLKSKPHAKLKRDPGSKTTVSAPVSCYCRLQSSVMQIWGISSI